MRSLFLKTWPHTANGIHERRPPRPQLEHWAKIRTGVAEEQCYCAANPMVASGQSTLDEVVQEHASPEIWPDRRIGSRRRWQRSYICRRPQRGSTCFTGLRSRTYAALGRTTEVRAVAGLEEITDHSGIHPRCPGYNQLILEELNSLRMIALIPP